MEFQKCWSGTVYTEYLYSLWELLSTPEQIQAFVAGLVQDKAAKGDADRSSSASSIILQKRPVVDCNWLYNVFFHIWKFLDNWRVNDNDEQEINCKKMPHFELWIMDNYYFTERPLSVSSSSTSYQTERKKNAQNLVVPGIHDFLWKTKKTVSTKEREKETNSNDYY